MGWADPRVGLGWVEYDKSTIFLIIAQHTVARDLTTLQVKYKGYENMAFFDQYIALYRKRYKIRP